MTSWRVSSIIDGDTFTVSPGWIWKGKSGNKIRPTGYNVPDNNPSEMIKARNKLRRLLTGRSVQLEAIKMSYDRLLSNVYLAGRNLADYFPEYQ